MKLVAAVKLLPTEAQATCLLATLQRCNEACNWLASVAWVTKTFGQFALHKIGYADARGLFGLAAQVTVRCIAKVADAYKLDHDTERHFRLDAAQAYDERIIRFVKDGSAVSIWTIEGRMVIPIVMGEHQRRLMAHQKGEIDLCLVRGKWMLAATCDIPETDEFKAEDWLGVDFGIVQLAVDSDGKLECSQTDIAYVAGLFDGEGCIQMSPRSNGSRERLRISLAGAHLPALEWVMATFGGRIHKRKPQTGKRGVGKAVHTWNQDKIVEGLGFLKMIRPFLKEKASQADIAILYLERRVLLGNVAGRRAADPSINAMAKEVCAELKRLENMAPDVLAA